MIRLRQKLKQAMTCLKLKSNKKYMPDFKVQFSFRIFFYNFSYCVVIGFCGIMFFNFFGFRVEMYKQTEQHINSFSRSVYNLQRVFTRMIITSSSQLGVKNMGSSGINISSDLEEVIRMKIGSIYEGTEFDFADEFNQFNNNLAGYDICSTTQADEYFLISDLCHKYGNNVTVFGGKSLNYLNQFKLGNYSTISFNAPFLPFFDLFDKDSPRSNNLIDIRTMFSIIKRKIHAIALLIESGVLSNPLGNTKELKIFADDFLEVSRCLGFLNEFVNYMSV